jgi:serine/threonine-protein kinase SRPK3
VGFGLSDIRSISPTRLHGILSQIKSENMILGKGKHSPNAPKQVADSADFSGLVLASLMQVRIIDFGYAVADHPPPGLGTPSHYVPPELCFGFPLSMNSDIWHLAYVLRNVHSDLDMFTTFFRIFEILVGTTVGYLGHLPEQGKGRFKVDEYGCREQGKLPDKLVPPYRFDDKQPEKSTDSNLSQQAPHLSVLQRQKFVHMLRNMLAYEPEKRL